MNESLISFPIDLYACEHTRAANRVEPGDVVVYTGVTNRRWVREEQRTWLLRVTHTEGQNIYGVNVYPRDGWDPHNEFVIVDGQVDHHGVYVVRRAVDSQPAAEASV